MSNSAPEVIWLQIDPEALDGTTWCRDKINSDDVEYVRADELKLIREDADRYRWLRQWAGPNSYNMPDSDDPEPQTPEEFDAALDKLIATHTKETK